LEARKQIIKRATKIARLPSDVKAAIKQAGLDDNQDAMLTIARAGSADAQLSKVKQLKDRFEIASPAGGGKSKAKAFDAADDDDAVSAPVRPTNKDSDDDTSDEEADEESHEEIEDESEDNEQAGATSTTARNDTTLTELRTLWKGTGWPEVWAYTPVGTRQEFVEYIQRVRCKAPADVVAFIRRLFSGRRKLISRHMYPYARTVGLSTWALRKALRELGYKRKKQGRGPGEAWAYLNIDRHWKERAIVVPQKVLMDAFDAESAQVGKAVQEQAKTDDHDPYYDL
jgi:hypothetical protein